MADSMIVLEPAGAMPIVKRIFGIASVSPFNTLPKRPKKVVTKLGQFTVSKGASIIICKYARDVHSDVVETPHTWAHIILPTANPPIISNK